MSFGSVSHVITRIITNFLIQLSRKNNHWFETPSRPLWRHCNDSADGIIPPSSDDACISQCMNWDIICTDNDLSPVRQRAITWANAALLHQALRTISVNVESEYNDLLSGNYNWKCCLYNINHVAQASPRYARAPGSGPWICLNEVL